MTRLLASLVCVLVVCGAPLAGRPMAAALQQPQFRSSVDVVELSVAVMTGKNVAAGLTAQDFHVLDNGVRQDVLSVSRELLPIDVTLVIDTSESLTPALQAAIVSAANGIRTRLKPADRLSLVTFNQRIQEQLALQSHAGARAIELGRVAGQTALNDAMGVVLTERPVTDRRQMAIVLTDGYDSSSLLTESDVVALAGRSNTSIFFIARGVSGSGKTFSAPLAEVTPYAPRLPLDFFRQVAAATGGVLQVVPAYSITTSDNTMTFRPNPSLLDEPFLQALDDFRSSYLLRYSLTGVPRKGWHDVSVKVTKPGKTYHVRTRTGYAGG